MTGLVPQNSALLQNHSHQSFISTTFPYTCNAPHSYIDSFRTTHPSQTFEKPANRSILVEQINNLHILNNELYGLIDLVKSTFFSQPLHKNRQDKYSSIKQLNKEVCIQKIFQLERQMREKFSGLIKNMKQFYLEIDAKLKKIGEMFYEQYSSVQNQTNLSTRKSLKKDGRSKKLSLVVQNKTQTCESPIKRSYCKKNQSCLPNKPNQRNNSEFVFVSDFAVDESVVSDSLKILENKKANLIKEGIRHFHEQQKYSKAPLQLLRKINYQKNESPRKSLKSILLRADKIKNSSPERRVSQRGGLKIS